MPEPSRTRPSSSAPVRAVTPTTTDAAVVERLRQENVALRAEVERLRTRYEGPVTLSAPAKHAAPEPEPEQLALVGAGERARDREPPSDEALDSVGETLCRMLEERQPGVRWRYYRDEQLVPEGVTFFYANEALRKMWGEAPGNPCSLDPRAYRRLTSAEREARIFEAELSRVDDALEPETFYFQGHVVAAGGLLKYVDLRLARFNLALAQAQAGKDDWQETLNDIERDDEFKASLAQQIAPA